MGTGQKFWPKFFFFFAALVHVFLLIDRIPGFFDGRTRNDDKKFLCSLLHFFGVKSAFGRYTIRFLEIFWKASCSMANGLGFDRLMKSLQIKIYQVFNQISDFSHVEHIFRPKSVVKESVPNEKFEKSQNLLIIRESFCQFSA